MSAETVGTDPGLSREPVAASDAVDYRADRSVLLGPAACPGPRLREDLTALTDRWVNELFDRSGAAATDAALVAIGGYGRRTLAPGSDLDLLLLHPPGAEVDAVAQRIWYPIWDVGIRLDHSVRTPAQARRLAAQDLRVVFGILDSRTVAGDPRLLDILRRWVFEDWRGMAPRRLEELRAAVTARTEANGELAYLLEPDLKESYGGLRDVAVLRALEAAWVAEASGRVLDQAVSTLLDVRDALHLVTGKGPDRLTLQEQRPVAERLGWSESDAMLKQVSAAGRSIGYACEVAWHQARRSAAPRRAHPVRRLRSGRPERAPLAEGVVIQEGEAVLAVDAHPERDPVLVLRAAAAAAQAGLRLSPHAVERLAAQSAEMPVPWPVAARDALVSLLGAGRSAIPIWEALDQSGQIERLIPQWGPVRSAPQHNPVHMYTVDRHLVQTAVNAAGLTRRVSRPDLLLLGALFHDIGKARGGDHTQVGMRLMGRIAPMIGLDSIDTAVLVKLVELHLLLPEIATRRDLDDPATAKAVAAAVETSQTLELLHAITEADARATGPAAWSQWKSALIDELVLRARAQLEGTPPGPRPRLTAAQLELADRTGVAVLVAPTTGAFEVTVAMDDRVGLLALVAGVLALHRLAVRSARTQTIGSRAVTTWVVAAQYGSDPEVEKLREDIRLADRGSLDLAARLRKRTLAYRRPEAPAAPGPRVELVPEASEHFTVLEARAHDAPALLYTIANAISSCGVVIDAAQVSTLGSEAVDVFYLEEKNGEKLPLPRAAEVKQAILDRLAESSL